MTRKSLSRRDAIKLLGAAAGATLLANLPSKWNTPELTSGVLYAHAQKSCIGLNMEITAGGGGEGQFIVGSVEDFLRLVKARLGWVPE